jgi:hypothetical protein
MIDAPLGSLAIVTFAGRKFYAIYRGKYSEFYNVNLYITKNKFNGQDPLVFTEQKLDGGWITRSYFWSDLPNREFNENNIEWLT